MRDDDVVEAVGRWAAARIDDGRVRDWSMFSCDGSHHLTVRQAAAAFDFALNRELADLCIALARDGAAVVGNLMPGDADARD